MESDSVDMANSATYAPYFDSVEVLPVGPVDDAWMAAIQKAIATWDSAAPG
ncbi:MAG: hypothetical protein ACRD0Z_08090 [Acidimicrobiales bacterium]